MASAQAVRSERELEQLRQRLEAATSEGEEKVADLERRLEVALGAKLEHMLALREEVEQEYADRMDELRDMYRVEMDSQAERFEQEKQKMTKLEASLQESLKVGQFLEFFWAELLQDLAKGIPDIRKPLLSFVLFCLVSCTT